MVTVSNTTPLRYLIAIHQQHLLEELFTNIVIPGAVFDELTRPRSPEAVRDVISAQPKWLEVRSVNDPGKDFFARLIHRGEREAIALAELLSADLLLIDEKNGRQAALGRNFKLGGTLGVLELAASLGLIKRFPDVLADLRASGFYLKTSLEERLLQRHKERRRKR